MTDTKTIGQQIKGARENARLTQAELAAKLQYGTQHISNLECDRYTPSMRFISDIEKVLNVTLVTEHKNYEPYGKKIQVRLSKKLRGRIRSAIKGNYKAGSAVRDLGCTIQQLKTYLEEQFKPGMTWNNWNYRGWHIDHIKPLASFDLTDREQFKEACHYTNLQPLWAEENFSKGASLEVT